ncbi:MAG TPA: hypothetical protein VER03_08800, partial [Bryobacteraceae bacterium]|nr:hypothetical protein [Bryobacteraceae bacterium]
PDPPVPNRFLPPPGASTTAAFYLRTQSTQEVEARVTVLYRNRVLQTWTLAGGAETDIAFLPEVIINASLAGLDRQTSPAAALVLNHTRRGEPQILKIVDDDAELISTGNLQPNVDNIEDELKRCDWGSKDFRALNAPGTLKLLRFLAVHGSLLYRGIVKRQFVDARLASAPSIQLIAARPGVRLPVEYFYDRPSPDGDATLCPAAEKSLSAGKCGAACAARNQSSRYICPLGFWGVSRVLEWHNYRSQHARELKSHDYALQQEKLARRKQLPPFDRVVVGASDRAKAEVTTSMSTLLKALGKAGLKAVEAKNWKTWKSSIAAERPPVLLMIPHTDIDEELNVAKLEIGKDQWLRVDQIQEEYIRANQTQPIVLLLGCETGKQAVAFEDFVSILTECGAAVVVTTSTLVLGRQATILAAEFAAVMNKLYGQKGATFGQVMLTVRRNMLRKGYPMVLSVSAYGDADWRL